MELSDETRSRLMDAGRAALRFNAPMSAERATRIASFLGAHADDVVDLGCGSGALAIELVAQSPAISVTGIDIDRASIERARSDAVSRGLADRVTFRMADVRTAEPTAGAISIGASHAFGGTTSMLTELERLARDVAVVGDGIWSAEPTSELLSIFGDQPDGIDGLADLARSAGWRIADASTSSLAEWDAFEHGWIDGVRSVGSADATAFADYRAADYATYRGVLGFGWLHLVR